MGKYFKRFASRADYESYINGGVALPNISFITGESGLCINSLLILVDEPIYVGVTAHVHVMTPERYNGENVYLEKDNESYSAHISSGCANFEINYLSAGERTLYAHVGYSGTTAAGRKSFTVNKRPSTVTVSVKRTAVVKDTILTITVSEGATGKVVLDTLTTREGVPFTRYNGLYGNIINGKAKIKLIPGWETADVGFYTATVTYEGDDKYLPSTGVSDEFEVYTR